MDHQGVLTSIVEWARSEHNIRAAALTGSVARDAEAADAEADLDVELYVRNPALLLEDDTWHHQFGEILVVEALENPGSHPTRLVYYADGEIDFMIAPVTVLEGSVAYARPFRVLLDKDGAARAFQRTAPAQGRPPTAAAFHQCIQWFYAAAIIWAKHVARDDPWAAKQRDWDSKTQLLMMLEWDHQARKGWDYDTWYLGVHLREWVDADLLGPIVIHRGARCWTERAKSGMIRGDGRGQLAARDVRHARDRRPSR